VSIRITASTLGQANPYKETSYYYRGDPTRTGGSRHYQGGKEQRRQVPEALRGAPSARAQDRAVRYKRFCELREQGMGKIAAGAEVGVERRAAARYEKQRLEEAETAS
jgi:hypothetical protein